MFKSVSNRSILVAGVAVGVLLGGGTFWAVSQKPTITTAETASPSTARETDGDKLSDNRIELTPAQIQAAGITVVAVTGGGGGEIRLAGRVEPMLDARAVVAASVGGRVERLLVTPGQTVRVGQPLVSLVSGEAATFRAEADAAGADAEAARQAYERTRNLFEQGIVARQEVETSRAQYLGAEAATRAARARSTAAGSPNASGRLSVTSPIAGVVTSVQIGPGGYVSQGGVVAEVTNPARVEMVFNAPPALASNLGSGTAMRVMGPSGEFEAVVTGIAIGAGDMNSGATQVRARPKGGVLPPAGSAVTGMVVTGQASGVLTVPSEAVHNIDGKAMVFVEVSGGFDAVPVMAGRQAAGRTEILRGLTGSERVAAANAFLLKAELAKGEAEHGH